MATTALKGHPVNTNSDLPVVGQMAPAFTVTGVDLTDSSSESYKGQRLVLNIFPSVDTPTCAQSVRQFNEQVSQLGNTVVLCISQDLPFALGRFCGAEGLSNVVPVSAFRSTFSDDYGVTLLESKLAGLTARAVVVLDEQGKVLHTELVSDITEEPNYDAVSAALSA